MITIEKAGNSGLGQIDVRFPDGVVIIALLVVGSHAILDTMTDGGLGCALFWPFDETRYFAPWRPIPVAPIGLAFFSARGLAVATTELIIFLPLLFYGMWPRSRAASPP